MNTTLTPENFHGRLTLGISCFQSKILISNHWTSLYSGSDIRFSCARYTMIFVWFTYCSSICIVQQWNFFAIKKWWNWTKVSSKRWNSTLNYCSHYLGTSHTNKWSFPVWFFGITFETHSTFIEFFPQALSPIAKNLDFFPLQKCFHCES